MVIGGVGAASAGGVYLRPKAVEREAPAALNGSLIKLPALPVVLTVCQSRPDRAGRFGLLTAIPESSVSRCRPDSRSEQRAGLFRIFSHGLGSCGVG